MIRNQSRNIESVNGNPAILLSYSYASYSLDWFSVYEAIEEKMKIGLDWLVFFWYNILQVDDGRT